MTVRLSGKAVEQSTAVVTVTFSDSDGSLVVPMSATWTLYDQENVIVNSRDHVSIPVLATSVNIVLTGDDLLLPEPSSNKRRLLLEAIYNSSNYGNDLSLREEFEFKITNLESLNPP